MTKPATKARKGRPGDNRRKHPEIPGDDLELKLQKFCLHYLQCFNGAAAARAVGFEGASASATATRWLARIDVKMMLARLTAKEMKRLEWGVEDSMNELMALAMVDVSDVATQNGNGTLKLKKFEELPEVVRRCIKSIKVGFSPGVKGERGEAYVKEVVMYDRTTALDMLNKHVGFYREDNEQKGNAIAALMDYVAKRSLETQILPVKP